MTDNQKSIISFVSRLAAVKFVPIEYGGIKLYANGLNTRVSGVGGIKNSDLIRKLQFLLPEYQGIRELLLNEGLYVEECVCCGADTNNLVKVREDKIAPICDQCIDILCTVTIKRS